MNALTREWLRKADDDASVAAGLMRRRRILADIICFHCQQAAEKMLKACLQEAGLPIRRTHDLVELLHDAAAWAPSLLLLENDAKALTAYSVAFRYPGASATKAEARMAVAASRRINQSVRSLLQ
jgi:HEPN domain-containing protein